jgi:predicted nucleic acid-binding protein
MFAVDSNIALDVLEGPDETAHRSAALLQTLSHRGAVITCGIVWAELAGRREGPEVESALTALRITVDWALDKSVFEFAVRAWRHYLERREQGGRSFVCPHCHRGVGVWECPYCGLSVPPPRHLMSDFLIGGHAEARGLSLITRDRGIYQRYFPDLALIQP